MAARTEDPNIPHMLKHLAQAKRAMREKEPVMIKSPTVTDLTGRDDKIVSKALAYAIVTIRNLAQYRQESSDCDDMLTILRARHPDPAQSEHWLAGARAHIGVTAEAELEEERANAAWAAAHPGEDPYC